MEFITRDPNKNKSLKPNVSDTEKCLILQKQNDVLSAKLEKATKEISEIKKTNKILSSKLNLLLNDTNIVKNVKLDMNDYSNICNNTNEDSLKEFFYLLLLSEKMKYVNIDCIWMIDSTTLYNDVINLDLPFYDWSGYIQTKLQKDYNEYINKIKLFSPNFSLIAKIKNLWYEASLSFFNKIKSGSGKEMSKMYNVSFKTKLQNIIKCKEELIAKERLKNKSNTASTNTNDLNKEISLENEDFENLINSSNIESECMANEINSLFININH